MAQAAVNGKSITNTGVIGRFGPLDGSNKATVLSEPPVAEESKFELAVERTKHAREAVRQAFYAWALAHAEAGVSGGSSGITARGVGDTKEIVQKFEELLAVLLKQTPKQNDDSQPPEAPPDKTPADTVPAATVEVASDTSESTRQSPNIFRRAWDLAWVKGATVAAVIFLIFVKFL